MYTYIYIYIYTYTHVGKCFGAVPSEDLLDQLFEWSMGTSLGQGSEAAEYIYIYIYVYVYVILYYYVMLCYVMLYYIIQHYIILLFIGNLESRLRHLSIFIASKAEAEP